MQHTLQVSPRGHAGVPTGLPFRVHLAEGRNRTWGRAEVAEDFEACRTYSTATQLGSMGSVCCEGTSQQLAPLMQGSRVVATAALVGRVSPEPHHHAGPVPSLSQQGCLQTAGPSLPGMETQAGTAYSRSSPGPLGSAEPMARGAAQHQELPMQPLPPREGISGAGPGDGCNENSLTGRHRVSWGLCALPPQ